MSKVIKTRDGLTVLPVRNPGHAATDWHMDLREYCTCPGCRTVWAHPETDDLKADWQWAQDRYGPPTTCGECGLTTAALPHRRFWREFAHGEYRYLVAKPQREGEAERE